MAGPGRGDERSDGHGCLRLSFLGGSDLWRQRGGESDEEPRGPCGLEWVLQQLSVMNKVDKLKNGALLILSWLRRFVSLEHLTVADQKS